MLLHFLISFLITGRAAGQKIQSNYEFKQKISYGACHSNSSSTWTMKPNLSQNETTGEWFVSVMFSVVKTISKQVEFLVGYWYKRQCSLWISSCFSLLSAAFSLPRSHSASGHWSSVMQAWKKLHLHWWTQCLFWSIPKPSPFSFMCPSLRSLYFCLCVLY